MKPPAAIAREKKGLTLPQAAKQLHMSTRTLSRYEAGRGANLYQARKIARLYGCPLFGCFTEQGIAAARMGHE